MKQQTGDQNMAGFLRANIKYVIAAFFVVYIGIRAAVELRKESRIDREGTETVGTVSRVSGKDGADGTYVVYTDDDGIEREGMLSSDSSASHEEGEEIRIRFLPGEYGTVREQKR